MGSLTNLVFIDKKISLLKLKLNVKKKYLQTPRILRLEVHCVQPFMDSKSTTYALNLLLGNSISVLL